DAVHTSERDEGARGLLRPLLDDAINGERCEGKVAGAGAGTEHKPAAIGPGKRDRLDAGVRCLPHDIALRAAVWCESRVPAEFSAVVDRVLNAAEDRQDFLSLPSSERREDVVHREVARVLAPHGRALA